MQGMKMTFFITLDVYVATFVVVLVFICVYSSFESNIRAHRCIIPDLLLHIVLCSFFVWINDSWMYMRKTEMQNSREINTEELYEIISFSLPLSLSPWNKKKIKATRPRIMCQFELSYAR